MAFLLPIPQDSRSYRDDDYLTAGRPQRSHKASPLDGATTPGELQALETPEVQPPSQRKHLVIADPVAFRYLEDDSDVTVVDRRGVLCGYESYLVEQWACSRESPTLVVVTYTGDQRHSVVVGILSVPADENLWSTKLRVYFKAIQKFHARPKDTAFGELMVTNLSSFPSALTVIPIPDGDIRKHRQTFIVNEDLKRLGCSGRSGLTLTEPAEATRSKFQQLYKISDRIPLNQAVMELIKLCQVALYMFEKLDHAYVDGLLCDKTETAINNWWIEVGAEHYNFEPTDGILGPSTVSALLGMLMGARNRLHWYGEPVSKDVFDIDNTKRGIGHFQKSQKLEKTRRLDRPTLLKLYSVTAKAASGEGWGVQKAVKSTVTEIGGKRGEIVMGMVSGKDKGGLADIETLDLDRFIGLTYGERPKWLWHGKPRRTPAEHPSRSPDLGNGNWKDEASASNAKRAYPLPIEEESEGRRTEDSLGVYSAYPPGSATSITESPDKDALRRTVFKSVADKMSDARSGFGRFKDAVGGSRRSHGGRPSATTNDIGEAHIGSYGFTPPSESGGVASTPAVGIGRTFTWKNKPEEYLAAMKRGDPDTLPGLSEETRHASTSTVDWTPNKKSSDGSQQSTDMDGEPNDIGAHVRKDVLPGAPSNVGSTVDENDFEGPLLELERKDDPRQLELSRRHSIHLGSLSKQTLNESRWPRRMSFGDAEEAILTWQEIIDVTDSPEDLASLAALAEIARGLNQSIDAITHDIEPWVTEKLKAVGHLDKRYARDKDDLQTLYHQLNDACQRVRMNSDELLAEERAHLTESIKEVEVLIARLEYETSALLQKIMDVEDGIVTFERQVEDVEKRADELKVQLETEGWLHWLVRTITGIGTGPNITRSSL